MIKNPIKSLVSLTAGMCAFNALIDAHASSLSKLQNISGKTYEWKNGKIFYRVVGSGAPILLIHNLGHRSASYEWDDIIHFLAKNNTVYIVDLPGCGRSDKPRCIYTSYLYISFIKSFTKDIIKKKPIVITSGDSSGFVIMANGMNNGLFSKIILINPEQIYSKMRKPEKINYMYMKMLYMPILGRTIYNIENFSYKALIHSIKNNNISMNSLTHTYNAYISSHLKSGNGRYLRGSKAVYCTDSIFEKYLPKTSEMTIILSKDTNTDKKTIHDYTKATPNIIIKRMDVCGQFPHMNHSGKVYSEIKDLL